MNIKGDVTGGEPMYRTALTLFLSVALSGCMTSAMQERAEHVKKARDAYESERDSCKTKFPTAARKNNLAYAQCINEAGLRLTTALQLPLDIFNLLAAKRTAISTQMDAGKISYEEGNVQLAQALADANSEAGRRINAQRSVAAQQQAADAATMSAIAATMPRTQTCNVIGSTVTCF